MSVSRSCLIRYHRVIKQSTTVSCYIDEYFPVQIVYNPILEGMAIARHLVV